VVWRDAVVDWFHKTSGIDDEQGRVGRRPDRVEAEKMQPAGYVTVSVTPSETASRGEAVVCKEQAGCSASTVFSRADGWYDVAVQYFDLKDGSSHYALQANGATVDTWIADDTLPSDKLDGHTSTRHVISGVALHRGDRLRITGTPDGPEPAPLDYIEITPSLRQTRAAVK